MVVVVLGKRNDVASVKDNFAALHIVEKFVSGWAAWRSWCQNAEMVTDPPYVEGRVGAECQIKRVPLKGGDGEANRMSKKVDSKRHLCVQAVTTTTPNKSEPCCCCPGISSHRCLTAPQSRFMTDKQAYLS
jgi:hypothetical protein